MDIKDMRKPYRDPNETFTEKDLVTKEPIGQFRHWFEEVCKLDCIEEANAVCLATCTKSGFPSSRMVLLKGFGKDGFKFFTNYCSRKGHELLENPQAALLFYWEPLKRQVRIEGSVVQVSKEESEEYFYKRPRISQISAAVSEQSAVVTREELLKKYEAMTTECCDESVLIPKPEMWGGFKVIPDVVEFWQGQTNRLHDRIRFRRLKDGERADDELIHCGEDGWVYERLAP